MPTDDGICGGCGDAVYGASFEQGDNYVVVCASCLNKALDELGA